MRFFRTRAELRRWFAKHHASEDVLWVGFYKTDAGKPSVTWPESVDEALSVGWIDGIRKRIDDQCYRSGSRRGVLRRGQAALTVDTTATTSRCALVLQLTCACGAPVHNRLTIRMTISPLIAKIPVNSKAIPIRP